MRANRLEQRLAHARQRLKDKLYAEMHAILPPCRLVPGKGPRLLDLFKALDGLEKADGPGALQRIFDRIPRFIVGPLRERTLWHLAKREQLAKGDTAG